MKKFYYDKFKQCYFYEGYFFYYFSMLKKWYVSSPDDFYQFNSKDECLDYIDLINRLKNDGE